MFNINRICFFILLVAVEMYGSRAALGESAGTTQPNAIENWKYYLSRIKKITDMADMISHEQLNTSDYSVPAGDPPNKNPMFIEICRLIKENIKDNLSEGWNPPSREWADNISKLHQYFRKQSDYSSLLLADTTKRMLLRWAQGVIINSKNPEEREAVSKIVLSTQLLGMNVQCLYGPKKSAASSDNNTLTEDTGVFQIVASWNASKIYDLPGFKFMNSPTFDDVASDGKKKTLLLSRIIQSEILLRVHMHAAIRYLNLGGTIASLDPENDEKFSSVMSITECRKFSFPLMKMNGVTSLQVCVFLRKYPISFANIKGFTAIPICE